MACKAIFLDRDDTLIEDIGYINDPNQVKLLGGVAEALIQLRELGYKLVVVTNQSGVARGILSEQTLNQIHERLKMLLLMEGAYLDKIYYCPYHPEGVVEKYRKESELRKPKPGMLLLAAKELDIDLARSWMIGNSQHDNFAGRQVGCRTILVDLPPAKQQSPDPVSMPPEGPPPDYRAVNLKEAANIVRRYERSFEQPPLPQPQVTAQTVQESQELQHVVEELPPPAVEEPLLPPEEPMEQTVSQSAAEEEQTKKQSDISGMSPAPEKTEKLLEELIVLLKGIHRQKMFHDFSPLKLIAGLLQIVVVFCLLMGLWFLMDTSRERSSIFVALGFAIVFQLMSLTLYIMREQE